MDRTGQATVHSVAVRAGVSAATVSRALNGRADVHEETRRRVLRAAESLGYRRPKGSGRRRDRAGERVIGLLTGHAGRVPEPRRNSDRAVDPDQQDAVTACAAERFSLPVLTGAEAAFGGTHVVAMLCWTPGEGRRERQHAEALVRHGVDGLLVLGSRRETRHPIPLPGAEPTPVVYAVTPSCNARDLSLITDDRAGGALAARHLLDRGCRRITQIPGPPADRSALERSAGFAAELARSGLTPLAPACGPGRWSQGWGRRAANLLLERHPDLDGVFCASDQIAAGAVDGLRDRGAAVPEDVAVVGYENWEPFAVETRPRLTTIDMNLGLLGRLAAERLVLAGNEPIWGGLIRVPPRLVRRGSA
ncbi:LacI family DNA-binding transcriptional regulator [Actinoalloteichus hymeniacidonis]|uniref:Transcriptional regulator, LacI family n=1 Tax=Actinoalloteichus hymeniacidonis TaxID=340345 RepID=A0AAC9HQK5_9PSEU|nr:LacI family DNA-binding transcriptional regulator [Actinoalloteichus hymeniacidonis]AOS63549.1 transcriptional regulator, LacI family [Actinoalloteichus hymeniacidonis]MBB5908405.1 LacI family transcriptional regulator [Actinoalloteichus hymeniacidonis]